MFLQEVIQKDTRLQKYLKTFRKWYFMHYCQHKSQAQR